MSSIRNRVPKGVDAPYCQIEIWDHDLEDYKICGKLAVASWLWATGDVSYVCGFHDKKIMFRQVYGDEDEFQKVC